MKTDEIQTLFDYNYWANARVLEAAAKVRDTQFSASGPLSHGSLRGTLVHTLAAEWIWRKRTHERVSPTSLLAEADFPTLASLVARWQTEEQAMRSFLQSLSDADLVHSVNYITTGGRSMSNMLWHILVHVVNHGTQTRSEAAVMLTEFGYSPGDLDLILYVRENYER